MRHKTITLILAAITLALLGATCLTLGDPALDPAVRAYDAETAQLIQYDAGR